MSVQIACVRTVEQVDMGGPWCAVVDDELLAAACGVLAVRLWHYLDTELRAGNIDEAQPVYFLVEVQL